MKKLITFFNTIKYLKLIQIIYKIKKKVTYTFINTSNSLEIRHCKKKYLQPIPSKQSINNSGQITFLNQVYSLKNLRKWNNKNINKLWLYNLHYFDYLNSPNFHLKKQIYKKMIQDWIKKNPVGFGNGWEPYPISRRLVNWIKFSLLGGQMQKDWLYSMVLQTRYLFKNLEYDILANHLFTNAKTLIYAGLFFKGKEADKWYQTGIAIFDHELKEQILLDGGHFELSPMYHSIFLEDLMDIINIHNTFNKKLSGNIKTKINPMLNWLSKMCHPDDQISFFNDSALNVAPNLSQLRSYSNRLGIKHSKIRFKKIEYLKNSGYIRLSSKQATAILDVGNIGPDYQPGHAHADTLSFEFSLFGKRLLVNTGTSEYSRSAIRNYERSTKAHNTVVVNNENSSEVWSGFRVAKRAHPIDLKIEELKKSIKISCSHDGYKQKDEKPIHRRHWYFFKNSLVIKDNISGPFQKADAYFHFHPSISIIKRSSNLWILKISNSMKINLKVEKGNCKLEKNYYSPEFGKKLSTNCLKVSLGKKGSIVKITWN